MSWRGDRDWAARRLCSGRLTLFGVGHGLAGGGGPDFLVQEVDGTSRFTLEDGSGAILRE